MPRMATDAKRPWVAVADGPGHGATEWDGYWMSSDGGGAPGGQCGRARMEITPAGLLPDRCGPTVWLQMTMGTMLVGPGGYTSHQWV